MEYSFVEVTVPVNFSGRQMEHGYKLSNGILLFDIQRNVDGYYPAAVGLDGIYLHMGRRFQALYDERGRIQAFREVISADVLTT